MSNQLILKTIETPIGKMRAAGNNEGIWLLEFEDRPELGKEIKELESLHDCIVKPGEHHHLTALKAELDAYFKGELTDFSVPVKLSGTEFQEKVWQALLQVPYGETRTYKAQTLVLGDLKAIRAVASANGKNKTAIIVPCHRIIGSDGSLTGYAGGIDRKRFLLNLERKIAGPKDLFSV